MKIAREFYLEIILTLAVLGSLVYGVIASIVNHDWTEYLTVIHISTVCNQEVAPRGYSDEAVINNALNEVLNGNGYWAIETDNVVSTQFKYPWKEPKFFYTVREDHGSKLLLLDGTFYLTDSINIPSSAQNFILDGDNAVLFGDGKSFPAVNVK